MRDLLLRSLMLYADKNALRTQLKVQMLRIREKELMYYTNNCLSISTSAALLAGFAWYGLTEARGPTLPRPASSAPRRASAAARSRDCTSESLGGPCRRRRWRSHKVTTTARPPRRCRSTSRRTR